MNTDQGEGAGWPQPRQHHYVPVSYLNRFVEKDMLWVLDLEKQAKFSTSPENILKVRDFYALELPDGTDTHVLESGLLSRIEAEAKPVMDEYLRTMVTPSGTEWQKLCKFLVALELRTVRHRQTNWQVSQYFNDVVAWSVLGKKEWFEAAVALATVPDDEWKEEPPIDPRGLGRRGVSLQGPQRHFVRHLQASVGTTNLTYDQARATYESKDYEASVPQNQFMKSIVRFLPLVGAVFHGMSPTLLMCPGRCRFVTSDDPVTRANPSHRDPLTSGMGLLCKGIELYIPLSPWACLMLSHGGPAGACPVTDDFVAYLNSLQGTFCYRFVVSRGLEFGWRTRTGSVSYDVQAFIAEFGQFKPRQKAMEMMGGAVPDRTHPFDLGKVRRSRSARDSPDEP